MGNVKIIDIDGLAVAFTPPEYLIIRKLEFFREGGSQKHLRDIASMLEESSDAIDHTFLNHHLAALNPTSQYQLAQDLVQNS